MRRVGDLGVDAIQSNFHGVVTHNPTRNTHTHTHPHIFIAAEVAICQLQGGRLIDPCATSVYLTYSVNVSLSSYPEDALRAPKCDQPSVLHAGQSTETSVVNRCGVGERWICARLSQHKHCRPIKIPLGFSSDESQHARQLLLQTPDARWSRNVLKPHYCEIYFD